jgi:DNA-binding response OmpR family regulator
MKIEPDAKKPTYIITVRRTGYRAVATADSEMA